MIIHNKLKLEEQRVCSTKYGNEAHTTLICLLTSDFLCYVIFDILALRVGRKSDCVSVFKLYSMEDAVLADINLKHLNQQSIWIKLWSKTFTTRL